MIADGTSPQDQPPRHAADRAADDRTRQQRPASRRDIDCSESQERDEPRPGGAPRLMAMPASSLSADGTYKEPTQAI